MKLLRIILLFIPAFFLLECAGQKSGDFFGYLPVKTNGKTALIDKTGNIVFPAHYDNIYPFDGDNLIKIELNGLFGLADSSLKIIMHPAFSELRFLKGNYVLAGNNQNFSILDILKGNMIQIGDSVSEVKYLTDDVFIVKKNSKWSAVRINGKTIEGKDWNEIKPLFSCIVASKNNKYGLFTIDGKEILPVVYSSVTSLEKIAVLVRDSQGFMIADTAGAFFDTTRWDDVKAEGKCIRLKKDTNAGLFSVPAKKMIIEPGQFSDFEFFSADLFLVHRNGKKGLINSLGTQIIPVNANVIDYFENSYFLVQMDAGYGLYSVNGNKIIDCKHDMIIKNENFFICNDLTSYSVYSISGQELWTGLADDIFCKGRTVKIYNGDAITLINVKTNGEESARETFEEVGRINVDKNASNLTNLFANASRRVNINLNRRDGNWFYVDTLGRWGLKNDKDSIIMKPLYLQIYRNLVNDSMVIVMRRYSIENSFFIRYGVVNEKTGKFVTPLVIYDIVTDDLRKKTYARCLLKDNSFAMLHKNGRLGKSRYAYIGDSYDGMALFNIYGDIDKRYRTSVWEAFTISSFEAYLRNFITSGKWGYIGDNSEIKIDAQFDYAERFINKTAIVNKNGYTGIITPDTVLLAFKYNTIERIAGMGDSLFFLRNFNREYGLSDESGTYLTDCSFDYIEDYSENRMKYYNNGLFGFLDQNGKTVIEAQFAKAEKFSEGLAAVSNGMKYGFADTLGNLNIDYSFKKPGQFHEGICVVPKGAGYGYINTNGDYINQIVYRKCNDFSNGLGVVIYQGKYGAVDKSGKEIIKPVYASLSDFDQQGYARFKKKDKYGIIDAAGKVIIPARYSKLGMPSEGLMSFSDDVYTGFMTMDKKIKIPAAYKSANDFKQSRSLVRDGSRYGYIDTSGQMVIPAGYSKAEDFFHGCAVVKGKNWGMIGLSGDTLISFEYGKITRVHDTLFLADNNDSIFLFDAFGRKLTGVDNDYLISSVSSNLLILYKYRQGYSAVSFSGDEVYKMNYSELTWIGDRFFRYQSMSNNGLADNKGNVIVEPEFEKIEWFGDNIFKISKGEEYGYLSKDKTWIWKPSK